MLVKNSRFSLGRIALLASLVACVLLVIYWVWLYRFHTLYPGGGLDSPLLNDLWFAMFVASLFGCPPMSVIALVCGILGRLRTHEPHRRSALMGALMAPVVLMLYSLYFFPVWLF